MISLLTHNRRVFIDVKNWQNNEQLIHSIENEQERENFAQGLADILDIYPQNVYSEYNSTKEILKRFACLCGMILPTQIGWFCPITGNYGALLSLTLCDNNNQWYTFIACDNYLSAEHCVPSRKHIIHLCGGKEIGKTPTMKMVFSQLLHKYPNHSIVFESTASYDAKGLFFIGNAKVGIDGQGDPYGRQLDSIEEFVSIGCDVILVSSRTSGMTVDAVNRFKNICIIDDEQRDIRDRNDQNACAIANRTQADKLVNMTEQFASQI